MFCETDPGEAIASVRYAIDEGINFFDVSPYYGSTVAETRLGQALEGERESVVLATKCGRYGEGDFDFTSRRIAMEFEGSLKRLRTDHVDLLQAHDVEFGDVDQVVEEALPAMRKLQEQGKARFIGISGYSLKNLMEIARRVRVDSILTYCRYNLMNNDLSNLLLASAEQHEIGIINASPLHMGLLTELPPPDWHPAPSEVQDAARCVVSLCERHGVNVSEMALRYCLQRSGASTTLVGMSTRDQVRTNLKALRGHNDPALMSEIQDIVAPVLKTIWPSGRQENRD